MFATVRGESAYVRLGDMGTRQSSHAEIFFRMNLIKRSGRGSPRLGKASGHRTKSVVVTKTGKSFEKVDHKTRVYPAAV